MSEEQKYSLLKMNKEEVIEFRAKLFDQWECQKAHAARTRRYMKKCDLIIEEWEKLEC